MRYGKTVGLVAVTIVFVTACTGRGAHDDATGRVDRPIYYGTPDNNSAVVAITNGPGTGFFCSGTLITPNVVLTAAHCLEGMNTSTIQIMFGDSVGSGTYVQTTEAIMHPAYDSYSITNDIALIRLDGSAPANVAPIPALPPGLALAVADEGSTIDISGFGQTETSSSGDKLHVSVTLTKVCPGPNGCSFGSGWAVPGSIGYPRTPGGTCYGDSGGPAFLARAGQQYVVGVTSYGDQGCTVWGVSTKVDAFATFINGFIGSVIPEDCGAPGDEDGDGLADCADPECALHPDCLGPDACEQALPLGCGAQVNATTVGAESQFVDYSCLSDSTENGPELAYELTAPAGATVTASLTIGGNGDLDLFLVPTDGGASCSPSACLQGSYNSGTSPESLSFTMPAAGAFLVVDTWEVASPFTLSLSCNGNTQTPDENCTNMNDDDGDGAVDCADPDCAAHPDCAPTQEHCSNQVDDDGDGAADCADPDCATHPDCAPGQPPGEVCNNGMDDDGDGAVDCADSDCAAHPDCAPDPPPGEVCNNGMDDDGDLIVDCYDPDCANHPACNAAAPNMDPVSGGQACNQSGSSPPPALPLLILVWLVAGRAYRGRVARGPSGVGSGRS